MLNGGSFLSVLAEGGLEFVTYLVGVFLKFVEKSRNSFFLSL